MAKTLPSEQLLLRRIKSVSRWLPAAKQCDPKGVHQARVATRRLREMLPVVAHGKKGRALLKTARRMTRTLGKVRELDVALMTLADLNASGVGSRTATARLTYVMAQERRALRAELRRRLDRRDIRKLNAWAAERRHSYRSSHTTPAQIADADTRCARRAAHLRTVIDNAAGIYLPDRLHQVRIGVKKLRYAMELVHDLRGHRQTPRPVTRRRAGRSRAADLRTLRQAQDLLGRMHDGETLIARTRSLQGTSAVTGLRLSADLDQIVRHLENECRQLHAKYIAERGRLLSVCARAETASKRYDRTWSAA